MIILQDSFPADDPPGVPLIGYNNRIIGVQTTSAATGNPASNLLNSATHLQWQASSTASQHITIFSGQANYVAIAKHNFFDAGIRISLGYSNSVEALAGQLSVLMHFEGTNGGTDYYDTSGNDVAFGRTGSTGTLTTGQFKFGTMSLSFNASGYVYTTASLLAFGSNDFTIDFWLRISATGSVYYLIDTEDSFANRIGLRKTSGNVLIFRTGNIDRITGTTALTTGQWYHVALTRSGTSTRLFLNGTQEGSTYSDSSIYAAPSTPTQIGGQFGSLNLFNGWIDEFRVLTGNAAFTANFTAPTSAYVDGLTNIAGDYATLLHFDGADAATIITDSGGADHVWMVEGNAQIDTAQFKFGVSSLLLDGTGDFIEADGSDDFAMNTLDFTIDFWIRPGAINAQQILFDTRPLGSISGSYHTIYAHSGNTVRYFINGDKITSSSTISVGTWMHIAVTRASGITRLFINGLQEGGNYSDSADYIITSLRPVIGINGALNTEAFNGHIDEVRIVKGTALWTTTFAVPTRAAGSGAIVGKTLAIQDALPIIFRFSSTTAGLALTLTGGTEAAAMAVIYAGELLVLERGVKVDVQHTDIVHARQSEVLAGMSESGNFLGRVLIREWRESQAEFAWFTPSWYRTYFEPFAEAAMTEPFFWAWNPDEYPEDTAFAWIIEELRPETDPATRRMAATISMRAIA